MSWDDLVRRWRHGRPETDRTLLGHAVGHVAVLPAPRRRRRVHIPWWIVVAIVGALAWLLMNARVALG